MLQRNKRQHFCDDIPDYMFVLADLSGLESVKVGP